MSCQHPDTCPGAATIRTSQWKIDELIAEVEHLAGTDGPKFLAERLGMRPSSLSARLRRAGRLDLAVIFDRTNAA